MALVKRNCLGTIVVHHHIRIDTGRVNLVDGQQTILESCLEVSVVDTYSKVHLWCGLRLEHDFKNATCDFSVHQLDSNTRLFGEVGEHGIRKRCDIVGEDFQRTIFSS